MPVPFKVKAVYEYKSDESDDLRFGIGQIITVTEEDDADWYTGEYESANGKLEGIFPRNFVEKYEPAIPSRPVRHTQKQASLPAAAPEAQSQPDPIPTSTPQAVRETRIEPAAEIKRPEPYEGTSQRGGVENNAPEIKTSATKQPPPVVDKPSSTSFKDRIAAFNKAAAPPIAPYKPTGGFSSASFTKKPFVPPPPSRNSYVPPPTQVQPPTKIYKREEDPEIIKQDEDDNAVVATSSRNEPELEEQRPKPTSLKDRIALLQQQQLEQAQRAADKKKAKKAPPPQRADSAEDNLERIASTEAPLTRQETEHASVRESFDSGVNVEEHELERSVSPEQEVESPTVVSPPPRELVSDTNDADDSGAGDTEDAQETSTEEDQRISKAVKSPLSPTFDSAKPARSEITEEAAGDEAEHEEDTEEEEDPETRRRRELRERMAKMSGGMGMMGMFGPPGGMPAPSKKPKGSRPEKQQLEAPPEDEVVKAPPVPVMALPGMSTRPQQHEADEGSENETELPTPIEPSNKRPMDEDYVSHQPVRTSTDRSAPTSPYERAAPPPPPRELRAPPPAPPSAPSVPSGPQSPPGRSPLPPPPPPPTRDDTDQVDAPQSPLSGRSSLETKPSRQPSTKKDVSALPYGAPPPPIRTMTSDSFNSSHSTQEKRASRPPPLPPTAAPTSPQVRAPPPPPPGQPPIRSTTGGSRSLGGDSDESEEEVTEYDGDYDTDIAPSAKHKDALKAPHNRDSSVEDETLTDEARKLPSSPPTRAVPPLPPIIPPRDVPPPLPASAPKSRKSSDVPRAAPPPIPTAPVMVEDDDDEYDPYRYSAPQTKSPPIPSVHMERDEEEDMYSAPSYAPPPMPPSLQQPPPIPTDRMPPPLPPPSERAAPPPPPHSTVPMMHGALGPAPIPAPPPRQSLDISRQSTVSRRSADANRPSADFGFMASDIDLAEGSLWWTHENTPPPTVAPRTDILFEVESNTTTKRGGKTTVNRDVYILHLDYSQTTINVSFDPSDPSNASISQSHQRPPPPPRQDQLESVSHSFGSKIASAASQAAGTTVADGSAQGFIWTLLQPLRGNALMPVGNRSFGATVYSNLANASTQQFDEIRPGDIVTFRNTKFAGHKGGLHQRYTLDAGNPGRDHVAVVIDWDGTKKKIRAWEQGREEKKGSKGKVKEESYRVGDLKSGELKVWRIMGRSWVGWDQS